MEESSTTGRLLRFVGLKLEGIMRPLSTAKTGQRLLATGNYTAFVMQVHTCVVRIGKLCLFPPSVVPSGNLVEELGFTSMLVGFSFC